MLKWYIRTNMMWSFTFICQSHINIYKSVVYKLYYTWLIQYFALCNEFNLPNPAGTIRDIIYKIRTSKIYTNELLRCKDFRDWQPVFGIINDNSFKFDVLTKTPQSHWDSLIFDSLSNRWRVSLRNGKKMIPHYLDKCTSRFFASLLSSRSCFARMHRRRSILDTRHFYKCPACVSIYN